MSGGDPTRQVAALTERAHQVAAQLRTGQDWATWLDVAARLPEYSFTNQMLITDGNAQATMLASLPAWNAVGRRVIKGEHGIKLIAPVTGTGTAPVPVTAFDIAQTTGKPLPPGRPAPAPGQIYGALEGLAHRHRYLIEPDEQRATFSADRVITIPRGLDEEQAALALAHELGHLVLHHPAAMPPGADCRGTWRLEADSIAYLLGRRLGLDADPGFPAVAAWAGSDPRANPAATVRQVADHVLIGAARITTHVERALPGGEVPQAAGQQASLTAARAKAVRLRASTPIAADQETPLPADGPLPDELLRIHDAAHRFYTGQVADSWVPGYLAGRGFDAKVLQQWEVGHAPAAWTELTDHLRGLGHGDAAIEASGLATRARTGHLIDRFRNRAIFPLRGEHGDVVAFIGRAHPHALPQIPKYLNSPNTAIYAKSATLFGLHEARPALAQGARPVLVEGPMDALAVSACGSGRFAGLATCGTAITGQQTAALGKAVDLSQTGMIVAYDADQAGQRATLRAYGALGTPAAGAATCATFLPTADPAATFSRDGAAELAARLQGARPLADAVIDIHLLPYTTAPLPLRDTVENRYRGMEAVVPIIAELPHSQIARQGGRVARILEVSDGEIGSQLVGRLSDEALAHLTSTLNDAGARAPSTAPQAVKADFPQPTPDLSTVPDEPVRRSHPAAAPAKDLPYTP